MQIGPGCIVKAKNVQIGSTIDGGEATFKAGRGRSFLTLLIGDVGDKEHGEIEDVEKVLNQLGFYRKEESDAEKG